MEQPVSPSDVVLGEDNKFSELTVEIGSVAVFSKFVVFVPLPMKRKKNLYK